MAPKSVDLYVRVSRVGDREHLTSPEDQERDARAFAASRGLTVGEVFRDLNESGSTLDRPEFAKVLERIESGKSAGVVVAYLSRASRDTAQGLDLLDRIKAAGGAIYAPNLPDYTTADGMMLTTIQFAIDTGYLQRKAAEFENAKRGAIENGVPVAHRAAVGYRKRADRRLEPDPTTAPVVRQVFELRAQGAGPTELGDILEGSGVTTSAGSRTWSVSAVKQLIANRVYIGELAYGRDRRYVNPDAHEPIVDLATWSAAQHPNGTRPRSVRSGDYLLNGILRCASCGYTMSPTRTSKDRGSKRGYRCRRRHATGLCPAPAYSLADVIEERVAELYRGSLQAALELVPEASHLPTGEDAPPTLAPLEDALEHAERRLQQALAPEVQDAARDAWPAMMRERREARDAAALELGRARAEQGSSEENVAIEEFLARWDAVDVAGKRVALAQSFPVIALQQDRTLLVFPRGSKLPEVRQRGHRAQIAPMAAIVPTAGTLTYALR